ncbi:2341_t:CDS:2, partial [Cetraspora pellucida]
WGIKFDLSAEPGHSVVPKCISQYVTTNTLVVVTVKVGVGYNQKIDVEVTDNSDANNKYGHKRDVSEETRLAFTTHANADISVCFTNALDEGFQPNPQYHRTIDLDIDIGAEAIDPNQFEKLKPMEAELRKLEQVVQEIVDEMEYLRKREARMRDTNVRNALKEEQRLIAQRRDEQGLKFAKWESGKQGELKPVDNAFGNASG